MKDNKLIHEFMGENFCPESDWDYHDRLPCAPLYDVSWNWLMPVVEKIGEIINSCDEEEWEEMSDYHFQFQDGLSFLEPDLEVTYEAVVEFIKWYNKENQ